MTLSRIAPWLVLAPLLGCQGFSKLDYSTLGRAMWQRPDDVIAALALQPGDHVADLGAGDGYFVPYLSAAVPEGRVYAVEVDPERIAILKERFGGDEDNVEVVSGEFADPKLPDRSVDLVLIVNTYHHIGGSGEERENYFRTLRSDLSPRGRVVLLEPDPDHGGLLGLFTPSDHGTKLPDLDTEMSAAGYTRSESYDLLPIQQFEVYTPAP
jgi:SAM-dependent methyltransferase